MSLQIQRNYNQELNKWNFCLEGEVDISTASRFRTEIEEAYQKKAADIELDFQHLSYIDSTGLGVMIGAYGRMKEKGNKIVLINPKENIKKLLSITSLDKVLCPEI